MSSFVNRRAESAPQSAPDAQGEALARNGQFGPPVDKPERARGAHALFLFLTKFCKPHPSGCAGRTPGGARAAAPLRTYVLCGSLTPLGTSGIGQLLAGVKLRSEQMFSEGVWLVRAPLLVTNRWRGCAGALS